MRILKINNFIKEEVQDFLNEKEYADEDFINLNDISLVEEYNKLNQQLFDNILPRVPLSWNTRKTSFGVVISQRNARTGEIRIKVLEISKFYKITYRQFKNTLAHEMIHIKQLSSGEIGNHGYTFDREARRINGMNLGFDITARSTEHVNVSDQVKGRKLIVMILEFDRRYYICVTTPDVYLLDSDFFFKYIKSLVNNGRYGTADITVIESENPELKRYRIIRSFKRGYAYYPLSDELLEQLLEDKIIKQIRIRKGVPTEMSEEVNPSSSGKWINMEIS